MAIIRIDSNGEAQKHPLLFVSGLTVSVTTAQSHRKRTAKTAGNRSDQDRLLDHFLFKEGWSRASSFNKNWIEFHLQTPSNKLRLRVSPQTKRMQSKQKTAKGQPTRLWIPQRSHSKASLPSTSLTTHPAAKVSKHGSTPEDILSPLSSPNPLSSSSHSHSHRKQSSSDFQHEPLIIQKRLSAGLTHRKRNSTSSMASSLSSSGTTADPLNPDKVNKCFKKIDHLLADLLS